MCGCGACSRNVEYGFPPSSLPLGAFPLGGRVGKVSLRKIRPILERNSTFELAHRGCKKAPPERSKMRQETKQNVDEAETLCSIRNVLIFDEDIEDLARAAEPFEATGFEVHKCMSVEAAMRSVEREEFEFAMVDQGSSAFEGRRVIRHLVRYNSHTPFVVVARRKVMGCCQQALALGATDYLEKPVPSVEMDRIIKSISKAH